MPRIFRYGLSLCLAASVLVPSVCGATERILLDGIAAKVNDATITIGDVLTRVQPLSRKLATRYRGDELREKMRVAYQDELNALIERQLILDAYEQQEGRIPDWAVEKRITEIIHDMFDDNRDALLNELAKDQRTYEDWKEEIRKQLIVASMQQNTIQRRVLVPTAAIYKAYKDNPETYRPPLEVKLRMIVLKKPADDPAAAEQVTAAQTLRRQLLEGADFAELARSRSQGAKADEGGDWGWIATGDLRPELKAVVDTLPVGTISDVIDTDQDLYIATVEDRKGGAAVTFDDVRQDIERDLKQAEAERLYKQWMTSLKKDAYTKISDVNPFAE